MNSSYQPQAPQPSSGKGMTIIIIVIVLLLLGVGGYFAYTKWWVPRQCNNRGPDTSSNVASFSWDSDSGKCLANVCSDKYGSAATGGKPDSSGNCFKYQASAKYNVVGTFGSCTKDPSGLNLYTSSVQSTTGTTDDCASACDKAGTSSCLGYDWDSGNRVCNLYQTPTPAGSNVNTNRTITCYAAAASK